MRSLVQFIGMKRSGNHAVINWLLKNGTGIDGKSVYYDNAYFPRGNPPRILQPEEVTIKDPRENILAILNYEDIPLGDINTIPTVVNQDSILENSKKYNILLLRDPFNLFASRLRRLKDHEIAGRTQQPIQQTTWEDTIKLYKSYAREFLGDTNILEDKIVINYNQWFSEKTYRDAILMNYFGQENQDIGIEQVSRYGKGSSFDGFYEGDARNMKLLNRWEEFENDEFYRRLVADTELISLSERIFGHISGTERLYTRYSGRERER